MLRDVLEYEETSLALSLTNTRLRWTWLIPLGFGLGLAYVLSGLLLQDNAGRIQPPRPEAAQRNDQGQKAQLDLITRRNVLNLEIPKPVEEKASKAPPPPPPPPPGSDPNDWTLAGTFVGEYPMALVTIDDESEFLAVNDVRHDWKLVSILNDRVRFEKGEDFRELMLFVDDGQSEKLQSKSAPPRPRSTPPPPPVSQNLSPGQTTRVELDRATADEALSDPGELLKEALFKPYVVNGETRGFRVARIRPDSMLLKAGLRNNDVLTRINGQAIDGPTKLMEVYQGLKNSDTVTMDVIRNNKVDSILVLVK